MASTKSLFAKTLTTTICEESALPHAPQVCAKMRCHGYDVIELAESISYIEMAFLLVTSELPTKQQATTLNSLAVAFATRSPRHPANRAVMCAAASKTHSQNLLSIGTAVLSGANDGADMVRHAWLFFDQSLRNKKTAEQVATSTIASPPGFGNISGHIDELTVSIAKIFHSRNTTAGAVKFGQELADILEKIDTSWLSSGLIAAVMYDLGIDANSSAMLSQWISIPGLIAHAKDFDGKPLTAYPFVDDEGYHFDYEK